MTLSDGLYDLLVTEGLARSLADVEAHRVDLRAADGDAWVPSDLLDQVSIPDTLHGVLMARIDRLSGVAIASARRIVSDLRPEMLEELGLRPALEALCAEHAQRWGGE